MRAKRYIAPALVTGIGLWLGAVTAAFGAEAVTTRAGVHEDFLRIVFDWPKPVEFKASIEGNVLQVSFARSLETDLGEVHTRLSKRLAAADVGEDGRSVRFTLAKPGPIATKAYGNTIIVDIRRSDADSLNGATVRVRAGEHPGFTRLVFDWRRTVDYRVRKGGDKASIVFSRPARIDLSGVLADLPRFVRAADSINAGEGAVVNIAVAPDTRLRNFRYGTKVVVDILGNLETEARSAENDKHRAEPPSTKSRAAHGETANGRSQAAAVRQAATPANAKAPARGDGKQQIGAPRSLLREPGEATEGAPKPMVARVKKPKSRTEATAGGDGSRGANEGGAGSATSMMTVAYADGFSGKRLVFPWATPVPAAVFKRADYLWVVFSDPTTVDFSAVLADTDGLVADAQEIASAEATVLRFALDQSVYPSARREGTAWVVELSDQAEALASVIGIAPQPHSSLGARLLLPVTDHGDPIAVVDPEVGDTMVIVPVEAANRGVAVERDFLEIKVLATAQGLALVPRADGIQVQALRNGVAVTTESGLLLSRSAAVIGAGTDAGGSFARRSPAVSGPIFHFDAWAGGTPEHFLEVKHELLRRVADSSLDARNEARMRLAQFYFAHGFAADSLAVLEAMQDYDPKIVTENRFRALRGAVRYLLRRYDEAGDDLFRDDFAANSELAMWRGAVAASREDWATAKDEFARGAGAIESYPSKLKVEFLLHDARTALATNDMRRLDASLTVLSANEPSEAASLEAQFLRARMQERLGNFEGALADYDDVSAEQNPLTRAKAEFARVDLLLKKGQLSVAEAIDTLDRIRYVWRGDTFEFALLKRLGELHLSYGNFRDGLGALRQAVTYYPKATGVRGITQRMGEEFERLFLSGGADKLSPVEALGLYFEFRELTPLGPKGDEMIRRLADRLVAVDLLDRAAKLLDHQVKFRLKGVARARVGAQLAVIYLLDSKSNEALRVLAETRWQPLPDGLSSERRRLEAKALAETGRHKQAMAILEGDKTGEAQDLRGEILWRAKDWARAATIYGTLLGDRWQREADLAPEETQQVMRLAVSLALAGDREGLDRLRQRYRHKFGDQNEASAFEVITGRIDRSPAELDEIADRIADIGTLQAFMTDYRQRLASGGLSTIN